MTRLFPTLSFPFTATLTKHVFATIFLIMMTATAATAQQYEVYRVRGEASLVVKHEATALRPKQLLTSKDILSLAYRSEVKMIIRETQEMITLKGQCAGSITSLISQQANARQKMTPDYFNFVISNLKGEGYNEGLQAGKSTTIFRDDNDSLFVTSGKAYLSDDPADGATPGTIHLPALVLRPDIFAVRADKMAPTLRPRLHRPGKNRKARRQ